MSEVKRFDCTNGNAQFCYGCYTMTQDDFGDYVLFEDYETLRARVAELEAQVAGLRALCARLQAWHDAVMEQPSFTNKYTYIRRPAPFEDK